MPFSYRDKTIRDNAKNRNHFFKARRDARKKREEDARLKRIAEGLKEHHDVVIKYMKPPQERGPGYTPGYVPLADMEMAEVVDDVQQENVDNPAANAMNLPTVASSSRPSSSSATTAKLVFSQAMAKTGTRPKAVALQRSGGTVREAQAANVTVQPVVNMCQDNDVDQRNPEGADDTVERTPPAGVNNTEQNQRPVVSVPSDASSTNSNENEPQEQSPESRDGGEAADDDGDDWLDADEEEEEEDPLDEFNLSFELFNNERLNSLAMAFLQIYATGGVKKTTAAKFWELHRSFGTFDDREMKGFPTLLKRVRKRLPNINMSWRVKDITTGHVHTGSGAIFPERRFKDKNRFVLLEMWSRITLKELMKLHVQLHPGKSQQWFRDGVMQPELMPLRFTCDGIPCGKSTPDSLHVTAVRFRGCKNVYILETRIARRKEPKLLEDFLTPFVEACLSLKAPVEKFLGDAPIRSFYKCMKGHAGYYSCEVCEARGTCVNKKVCYPSSTMGEPLQTMAKWTEAVEEQETMGVDNVSGITGKSPLLRLPGFDMVSDSPSDPLHRDFLGITKNMWRLCVNPNKQGNMSARTQSMVSKVSKVYASVRLPHEFSHRARPVDMANFKSHEWKSLLMTSFPIIADAGQELRGGHCGVMWTLFVFLLRIYNGPEQYMQELGEARLRDIHKKFYKAFESEFGEGACSFNLHAFSHMIENRQFGRQHDISTESFESAYGMIQLSYAPGTRCIGKQILERMLIRLLKYQGHYCEYRLKFEQFKQENRYDDSIVTDDNWNFFKVKSVNKDTLKVVKIHKRKWVSLFDTDLPFDKAGVFQFNGYSDEEIILPKTQFTGKGVMYEKRILMGLYWDLLFS